MELRSLCLAGGRGAGAWPGSATTLQGYETDGERSIQRLYHRARPGRAPGRTDPAARRFDRPRRFEFGLQASPTKPMRADWRGHQVPGGGGMSVVVWGGFNCADKVPANKDWSIVDKILEGRKTGKADLPGSPSTPRPIRPSPNGGAKPGQLRCVPLEQAQANGQAWLTAV